MNETTALFRLLGDDVRLRILRLLEKDRLNVSELTSILGIAQPGANIYAAKKCQRAWDPESAKKEIAAINMPIGINHRGP